MLYPDKLMVVGEGLSLYIPDPELVKHTYENLLVKDTTTPFPFWAKIWPAAEALCLFLREEYGWIKDKSVLELGAGIGLPSFGMAEYASEMIISDQATEAVALIEKNIGYLGLANVRAMRLDWNHIPGNLKTEIVLLSDINYAPEQFGSLLLVIRNLLENGATIILSTPQRITATTFVTSLQPFIKRFVSQKVEHMKQSVDISILILSK